MAQPASRGELIEYVKRKLGAPVLEINVADEQIEDLVDDAVQFFQERHFDGVVQTYLKYKITQEDIDRGRAPNPNESVVGLTTDTVSASIIGETKTFSYNENSNYIAIPPTVVGVNKLLKFDGSNAATNNMFGVKYQMFLNDIYYWGSTELLTYSMTKSYLETIDFLLTTHKQIRFNKRQDRLYLDIDWKSVNVGDYIIIDCWRVLDPNTYTQVWNDSFLKPYLTALVKRQWGQNLIKFQGVRLPGGVELNGRQMYDDGQRELDAILDKMSSYYELPPLDMIG
jgi:hypothetical protein